MGKRRETLKSIVKTHKNMNILTCESIKSINSLHTMNRNIIIDNIWFNND